MEPEYNGGKRTKNEKQERKAAVIFLAKQHQNRWAATIIVSVTKALISSVFVDIGIGLFDQRSITGKVYSWAKENSEDDGQIVTDMFAPLHIVGSVSAGVGFVCTFFYFYCSVGGFGAFPQRGGRLLSTTLADLLVLVAFVVAAVFASEMHGIWAIPTRPSALLSRLHNSSKDVFTYNLYRLLNQDSSKKVKALNDIESKIDCCGLFSSADWSYLSGFRQDQNLQYTVKMNIIRQKYGDDAPLEGINLEWKEWMHKCNAKRKDNLLCYVPVSCCLKKKRYTVQQENYANEESTRCNAAAVTKKEVYGIDDTSFPGYDHFVKLMSYKLHKGTAQELKAARQELIDMHRRMAKAPASIDWEWAPLRKDLFADKGCLMLIYETIANEFQDAYILCLFAAVCHLICLLTPWAIELYHYANRPAYCKKKQA